MLYILVYRSNFEDLISRSKIKNEIDPYMGNIFERSKFKDNRKMIS